MTGAGRWFSGSVARVSVDVAICVRCAAFGLLKRGGARVELVTDAVQSLDADASALMLQEFVAAGGTLTKAEDVIQGVTSGSRSQ